MVRPNKEQEPPTAEQHHVGLLDRGLPTRFWVRSADVDPTSSAPSPSKTTGEAHNVAGEAEPKPSLFFHAR